MARSGSEAQGPVVFHFAISTVFRFLRQGWVRQLLQPGMPKDRLDAWRN
jgi:hypothetical protein